MKRQRRTQWTVLVGLMSWGCGGGDAPPDIEQSWTPVEAFVQLDNSRLHYIEWGGEGQLMLMIPGITGTAHAWAGVAPHFTDTHRVVSVTRRGHGQSSIDGLDFDLDALADDLGEFLDSLGGGPAVVVGWSYAGLEMPRLARRHPSSVAGLVFVDALFDGSEKPDGVPDPPGWSMPDSVHPSVASIVAHWGEAMPRARPELLQQYFAGTVYEGDDGQFRLHMPDGGEAESHFLSLIPSWSPQDYDGIESPVLAIVVSQGEWMAQDLETRGFPEDSLDAARRWASEHDDVSKATAVSALLAAVPDAEVVVLDDVSHSVPLERPELLVELIRAFLARN